MNKVWYITGVTSGIGENLTNTLLNNGYKVAGTSRNFEKLLNKKIFIENNNFLPLQVDLSNPLSVEESIKKTIDHFGTITTIVCNAGFAVAGSIEETDFDEYKEIFDVMFFGPLYIIKSVLPYFRKEKFGNIFNIGSTGGINPVPCYGAYACAKSSLLSLSESLYNEVKNFNINVSYVVLGLFKTSIIENKEKLFVKKLIEEYNTIEKLNNSHIIKCDPCDPIIISKLLIKYSNETNIPNYIFIGEKDYMDYEITPKIKKLENELKNQLISYKN